MKKRLLRSLFTLLFAVTAFSCYGLSPQTALPARAELNGLALRPLMGWSSLSDQTDHPNEATFEQQAQAEARYLKPYGYIYANLNDYWYNNPETTVDAYGRWTVDTSIYPSGIPALAAYVHSLGLRFGLYVTPGIPVAAVAQNTPIEGTVYHAQDIANTSVFEPNYNHDHVPVQKNMYAIDYSKPGAQEFVNSWARLFASWGVDFLKLDGVGSSPDTPTVNSDDLADIKAWSLALRSSGHPIYFDVSNTLNIQDASFLRQYANGWRIDIDIADHAPGASSLVGWSFTYPSGTRGGILTRFTDAPSWAPYAGPGGWNDLDDLYVGNGTLDKLTNDERQTYTTLWAISAAPFYTSDDLTQLDTYGLSLLTNREVTAVDQAGVPAVPLSQATNQQVWHARERDGSYIVALFNLDSSSATVSVNWSDLGIKGPVFVRDLWSHSNLGSAQAGFSATLNAHGSRLLRISSASQFPALI